MEYYIIVFLYKQEKYYFLWKTDEKDEFLTKKRKIIFWKNIENVKKFVQRNHLVFAHREEIVYNIDLCESWCYSSSKIVDCNMVLDLWNIFFDLHNSISEDFIGATEEFDEIYDKLFYGNNLSTINVTNKKYIPTFTDHEIEQIKKVLRSGIIVLKNIVTKG